MSPKNSYQKEYIFRINKVIDFIYNNLDKKLNLETLAQVANFSPYHFHRIFAVFTGETLNNFVKRLRVEKAAGLLLTDPDKPISEIAYYCGYTSNSVFSREFKLYFKCAAKEYRVQMQKELSKNGKQDSKIDKLKKSSTGYIRIIELKEKWRNIMKTNIEVKKMPEMDVIYCRHVGEFSEIGVAYEKLFKWAGPRGLVGKDTQTITVYHDDPRVTDMDKLRQSAGIVINSDVKPEGEFGRLTVLSEKYAVGRFELTKTEFSEAWNTMFIWISENGYQPIDLSPYELYYKSPESHLENKFELDICIPVKPL